MIYKEIILKSESQGDLRTELLFNIASERASGVQLLRFFVNFEDNSQKIYSSVMRILRSLKSRGAIQLYACREDFENNTREAEYLINKYSEILGDEDDISVPEYSIYVRL